VGFRTGANLALNTTVTPSSYSVIQSTGAGVYDLSRAGGGKSPFFASDGLGLYRSSANDESQTDFGQNLGLGFNFTKYRFKPFVEGRFHFSTTCSSSRWPLPCTSRACDEAVSRASAGGKP